MPTALIAPLAASLATALSGAGGHGPPAPEPMTPAQMRALLERTTPGPMHEALARRVGLWDVRIETYPPDDPDRPAAVDTGRARVEVLMGGRYIRTELRAEVLGRPLEAMILEGHCVATGRFELAWLDDMQTSMARGVGQAEGRMADGRGRVRYEGEPGPDGWRPITSVEWRGDSGHAIELGSVSPEGAWVRMMVLEFTRALER